MMDPIPPTRFDLDDRDRAVGAAAPRAQSSASGDGADSTPNDAIIKTGTTTLGLVGTDGALLAADTRASLGASS